MDRVRPYTNSMGDGSLSKRSWWAVPAVVAAVLLGGCGGDSDDGRRSAEAGANVVQPGAPGEPSSTLSAEELANTKPTPHSTADIEFMQGMIHHHAQALVMTSMVPKRSAGADVPLLARRTEISQESEIEVMERWLRDRAEKPPDAQDHRDDHGPGSELMPGMVSADELARLAAVSGDTFDRRFLAYMIRHHRGALTMTRRLAEANGGAEAEIGAFVRHVESDQEIEIGRMQEVLAELEQQPAASAPRRARPSRAAAERIARDADGQPLICIIR